MKLQSIILSISILLITSSCSENIEVNHSISNINKRLDNFLDLQLSNNQFPGIQYVVFDKDKILYEYSGGYAKVAAKEKMTSNSVLNVFSTTKVVTAIAVLQLAQDQKLLLTDKVIKYIPTLPYKNVTISQVLSQSSGIPNVLLGNFYVHWLSEHDSYNSDLSLNSALENNIGLVFEPGEEIGYSNMGYAILGKVIENVSGLKYEEYITENIFNRLKLNSEKINFNSQRQKNSALPYFRRYSLINNFMIMFLKGSTTREEGVWKSITRPFYFDHPSHGGIVASASEYAKIFMSLMRVDNSVLLSSDFIKKMFSKQISYKEKSMAVSWFMGEMNNVPYFYHQGSGIGYIAEVRIYPKEKFGSILLMNRSEYKALSILNILDSEFIASLHKLK